MAKPQLEQGYTRIAHELVEVLGYIDLTAYEYKFILVLIRFTYGWRTTWAEWSNKVWAEGMNTSRQNVNKVRNRLLKRNIITHNEKGIRLNKDHSKWCSPDGLQTCNPQRLQVYPSQTTGVARTGYKKTGKPKKKKDLKGGKDSKDRKIYSQDSDESRLAVFLYKKITSEYAKRNYQIPKEPDYQKWSYTFDLMVRLDGRTTAGIKDIIDKAMASDFWWSNIRSPTKLREQYDQLIAKLGTSQKQVGIQRPNTLEENIKVYQGWLDSGDITEDRFKELKKLATEREKQYGRNG